MAAGLGMKGGHRSMSLWTGADRTCDDDIRGREVKPSPRDSNEVQRLRSCSEPRWGLRWLPLTILLLAAAGGRLSGVDPQAWAGKPAPHYVLAMSEDHWVCPGVHNVFNRLLARALSQAPERSGSPVFTDFEVTDPNALKRAGLIVPLFIKEIGEVKFYSVVLRKGGQHRVLAVDDGYQNLSPYTRMALFKPGGTPAIGSARDHYDIEAYYPKADVERVITLEALSQSQRSGPHLRFAYLLTRFPGFGESLREYQSEESLFDSDPKKFSIPKTMVPRLGGSVVTMRPFQSLDDKLYVVIDAYWSLDLLLRTPPASSTVVVMRIRKSSQDDVCYLVGAPGGLSNLLEKSHGRR